MAEIIVRSKQLEQEIKKQVNIIINRSLETAAKDIFFDLGDKLADRVRDSSEFSQLKGPLQGEFGFTDEEVRDLDKAIDLLIPSVGNDISKINVKTSGGGTKSVILEWLDFNKFKDHPLAQHELTKLIGGQFQTTQVVSWVDWLENGVTVRNYEVFDVNNRNRRFSRSGLAIMRETGGFWIFKPTSIFRRTANSVDQNKIRRGFGVIIEKVAKIHLGRG